MMERAGGSNRGMKEFTVGTMDEVIYSARGTFDDWAYAVGKHPDIITTCRNYQVEPYPTGMSNALVFIIELGPQNTLWLGSDEAVLLGVGEKNKQDGYVSRGIRVVRAALDVVSPTV